MCCMFALQVMLMLYYISTCWSQVLISINFACNNFMCVAVFQPTFAVLILVTVKYNGSVELYFLE